MTVESGATTERKSSFPPIPEVTGGEMRRQFRRCSGGKAAHVETQFRQGVEDEMTLESGEVRHQYLLKAAYDL